MKGILCRAGAAVVFPARHPLSARGGGRPCNRKELAQRLLAETDFSLAEVAFLTGFAEQSGFNRAFKRWAGQTPRSYRLGASRL